MGYIPLKNPLKNEKTTPDEKSNRISDPDGRSDAIQERAARLKEAVRNAGGNSRVASISGVPFGTLNHYMSGRDEGQRDDLSCQGMQRTSGLAR